MHASTTAIRISSILSGLMPESAHREHRPSCWPSAPCRSALAELKRHFLHVTRNSGLDPVSRSSRHFPVSSPQNVKIDLQEVGDDRMDLVLEQEPERSSSVVPAESTQLSGASLGSAATCVFSTDSSMRASSLIHRGPITQSRLPAVANEPRESPQERQLTCFH